LGYITKDRDKGYIFWHIVWLATPDAKTTNELTVAANEIGWFYTHERISANQFVGITGAKTNQGDFLIMREPYTVVRKAGPQ
jgi:hypothetical protein